MKDRRLCRIACFSVLGVSGLLWGCTEGHGEHTAEFKSQAVDRLASLKAATTWDMAYQQFKSGDLSKALKTVDQAIALEGNVAKSHVLRARIMFEMDRPEPALVSLTEAIRLDPTLTEAYYYQGVVFERVSEFEKAAESYQKASSLDSTDPQYVVAASEMLIKLGRLDDAQSMLTGGEGAFEHNAGIRQTLGHLQMMRGEPVEAVRLFSEAALLAPSDSGIQEDLTRAEMESGDFASAETGLVRLLAKSEFKDRADLMHMRVRCLMQLDRPVEARSILQARVHDDKGVSDEEAWATLGQIALKLSDQIQLRLAATRLMALAPHRETGFVLMAMWHNQNGTPGQGIDVLDRFARVSDLSVEGLLLRCVLCQALGDAKGALASARQAAKLDPTDERAVRLAQTLTSNASVADAGTDAE